MTRINNIRWPELDGETPITPRPDHLRRAGYFGAVCIALYLAFQATRLILELRARGVL